MMHRHQGSTRALLCLTLLLPLALPVQGEDSATPPTDAAAATPAAAASAAAAPTAEEAPATTEPATGETPAAAPVLEERSQVEAKALERQLPAGEQQQLQAGADTFLALWQPANVGEPSGVVILLPGDGESADAPRAIGPLRHKLPDAGWHSLSLTLPDPKDAPLPALPPLATHEQAPASEGAATGEDAAASETEPAVPELPADPAATPADADIQASAVPAAAPLLTPEEQNKAHAERVFARIEAGIAFAEQQQATTLVLLGHGSGAYWAARYLAERKPAQVKNLLLVAAEVPAGFSPALDELVPSLQLATGDFFYKDQAADRTAATIRLQASKRQKHPAYIQVAMKALPGNPGIEQEQLYRRIRGWLSLQIAVAP